MGLGLGLGLGLIHWQKRMSWPKNNSGELTDKYQQIYVKINSLLFSGKENSKKVISTGLNSSFDETAIFPKISKHFHNSYRLKRKNDDN